MKQTSLTLNDGATIPQLGLGCYRTPQAQAAEVVRIAIDAGYRALDTAAIYANEEGVGEGLRASRVPPDAVHVTTKLWIDRLSYDGAQQGLDWSLKRLGRDTVDLYLIHWPNPGYEEAWRGLARAKAEGRARSIGVSNFTIEQLERIIGETGVVPAVNQIELHPRFPQHDLRAFHRAHGIATQCWAPLGRDTVMGDPKIAAIAAKHGRTEAQVILRWHIQHGLIAIPKSVTPARIVSNLQVFDFALDAEDLVAIDSLARPDGRTGPDPRLPHPWPQYRSPENR